MDFAWEVPNKSVIEELEFILVRKDALELESKSEPIHMAISSIDAKVASASVSVCEIMRCILVACKNVQHYQLVAIDVTTRISYYMMHPHSVKHFPGLSIGRCLL